MSHSPLFGSVAGWQPTGRMSSANTAAFNLTCDIKAKPEERLQPLHTPTALAENPCQPQNTRRLAHTVAGRGFVLPPSDGKQGRCILGKMAADGQGKRYLRDPHEQKPQPSVQWSKGQVQPAHFLKELWLKERAARKPRKRPCDSTKGLTLAFKMSFGPCHGRLNVRRPKGDQKQVTLPQKSVHCSHPGGDSHAVHHLERARPSLQFRPWKVQLLVRIQASWHHDCSKCGEAIL